MATIRPQHPFHPSDYTESISEMLSIDPQIAANSIVEISREQRQLVRAYYASRVLCLGNLLKVVEEHYKGDALDLIVALLRAPSELDAYEIHAALKKDPKTLVEIIASRSLEELDKISEAYQLLFETDLKNALESVAQKDIKFILKAFLKDPMKIQINCEASDVIRHYEGLGAGPIDKAIDKEFTGELRSVLNAIALLAMNVPRYFATRLHKSMKGLGTDESALSRVVVTRSEIDLEIIKKEFHELYGQSLEEDIKGDTSGIYRDTLLAICKGNH